MENPIKMDDLEGFPIFLVQHPYPKQPTALFSLLIFRDPQKIGSALLRSNRNLGAKKVNVDGLSREKNPRKKTAESLKSLCQGTRTGVPLTYVYYHGTYRAYIGILGDNKP